MNTNEPIVDVLFEGTGFKNWTELVMHELDPNSKGHMYSMIRALAQLLSNLGATRCAISPYGKDAVAVVLNRGKGQTVTQVVHKESDGKYLHFAGALNDLSTSFMETIHLWRQFEEEKE